MSTLGHNLPPDDVKNAGWFAVARDIFDHPVIGIHDRAFSEFEAWLWLLANASYEQRKVLNKGRPILLDPGQLMAAHSFLATRWKWSSDKVRWYLKRLATECMIARYCAKQSNQHNTNQIQIITICNYSEYQFIAQPQHQPEHQPEQQANTNPTPSEHQPHTKNLTLRHLKEKNRGEGVSATSGRDFWSKAMRVEGEHDPDEGVRMVDGVPQLFNGTLAKWLEMFGGDQQDLDLALTAVAQYIQPNSSRPVKVQIESQLAAKALQKRERDKRYANAAKAPGKAATRRAELYSADAIQKTLDELDRKGGAR